MFSIGPTVGLEQRMNVPYSAIRFGALLGAGSFGTVYKGEWQKTPVAIKLCSSLTTPKSKDFLDEAKLMM